MCVCSFSSLLFVEQFRTVGNVSVLGKHALTETVHYAGEAEALRSEVKKKEDQIWALTDTITRQSHQLADKGLHCVCVCLCVCVCVCSVV